MGDALLITILAVHMTALVDVRGIEPVSRNPQQIWLWSSQAFPSYETCVDYVAVRFDQVRDSLAQRFPGAEVVALGCDTLRTYRNKNRDIIVRTLAI